MFQEHLVWALNEQDVSVGCIQAVTHRWACLLQHLAQPD